jgi:hypothetical protein
MPFKNNDMENTKNKSYFQYFQSIDICIENKLILPSLILIYSGIDIFSWVAYGEIGVRNRFTKWIDNHMYKVKKLSPDPVDLYAARCAILHTLTPDSDLSKEKKAVTINYAWGNAKVSELEKSIEALMPGEIKCVHLDDLYESFRLGVDHFLNPEGKKEECKPHSCIKNGLLE